MKKYLIALLFTVIIGGCYYFVNIKGFSTNFPSEAEKAFFSFFQTKPGYPRLIILNAGDLNATEIQAGLDTLLTLNPRMVGINMCDFESTNEFRDHFSGNPKVVMSHCDNLAYKIRFSRIVEEGNIVTHFRTDNPDAFEIKLTNSYDKLSARGNSIERINFRTWKSFHFGDLEGANFDPSLEDFIVLVGNPGDYWSDEEEIYDYEGRRITPMNAKFGHPSIPPDMDDMLISANIITTIETNDFFTEVPNLARVSAIFFLCLINVLFISFVRTPWALVNLALYVAFYYLLVFGAVYGLLHLFITNYYTHLNELQVLLIITSTFTIVSTYQARRDAKKMVKAEV